MSENLHTFYDQNLKNCKRALPCFNQDGDSFCGVLFEESPRKTHYFSFADRKVHLSSGDAVGQKNFIRNYTSFRRDPSSDKIDLKLLLLDVSNEIRAGGLPSSFVCMFCFENDLFFYYFDNVNSTCYEFILFTGIVDTVHEKRKLSDNIKHWDYYIECRSDISAQFFKIL